MEVRREGETPGTTERSQTMQDTTGYCVPTLADATYVLDGHELVTRVRPALHIVHEIERYDRDAIASSRPIVLYPRVSRAAMRDHGLYLVHNIPRGRDDFNGELLVTGDRLAPLRT